MKNLKLHTKLIIGFSVLEVLLIVSLFIGYNAVKGMMNAENPEQYLSNFASQTGILFGVMVVMSAGVIVVFSQTIRKGCAKLNAAAGSLAAGMVDIKLEKDNNDEFGELMDSFQKVVNNTRYNAQIIQELADGNLTMEVRPKSEEDVLGLSLRKLVKHNHQVMSNIQDSAQLVGTSSAQVASASEALAQGSTEQASAIEQITASISDVAERTKQNASQANTASDLISKAIDDVKRGNQEMEEMVIAMQDINKASESISKIIKVIDDIAFQTNILALNAAVEAARAGEAGKGFAVVAEEVRNLAAKSASAAAETAEMIEDSIQKVGAGSQIANRTAQALEQITNAVKQSETIIIDIAEASNYQATAIAQIDQAVEQVSQVVQNNSATSQQCAAASTELANQVSRVRDLLSVYKLDRNSMTMSMSDSTDFRFEGNVDNNEQIISLKDGFGKY